MQEIVPGATWKQAVLRDAVGQLAADHALSVLRDRRVDPTTPITLSAANIAVEPLLTQVAAEAGAETRIVGNCVYVGPPATAEVLRTIVELRQNELPSAGFKQLSPRVVALRRGQTVRWADLTEARAALQLVAERFELRIENSEALPHDVWGGAVLAGMPCAEMLSLILIQFDMTFEWSSDLRSVRLIPLPADRSQIVIARSHRPRTRPSDALMLWRKALGDFSATVEGDQVVVLARLEQHEEIERLISGKGDGAKPIQGSTADPVPLSRRQFTLKVSEVPAKAVIEQLEATGITFEWDADALRAAKVDFNKPISMNVHQADAAEFFQALFGPLGLGANFSGTKVQLGPADPPR